MPTALVYQPLDPSGLAGLRAIDETGGQLLTPEGEVIPLLWGKLTTRAGGDGVGGAEADAADVARQPVGVVADHLDGIRAVGLEDPHRPRGAHSVFVQEHHDLANGFLVAPGQPDFGGPLGTDAGDLDLDGRLVLVALQVAEQHGEDHRTGTDQDADRRA